jgi:hypothetical protein
MLAGVCPPALASPRGQAQVQAQAAAPAKPRLTGRSLIEVLREFQAEGFRLIFSSDLVSPSLRIAAEPRGRNVRAIIADLLAPHGLTLRDGPRGTLLIVRASNS